MMCSFRVGSKCFLTTRLSGFVVWGRGGRQGSEKGSMGHKSIAAKAVAQETRGKPLRADQTREEPKLTFLQLEQTNNRARKGEKGRIKPPHPHILLDRKAESIDQCSQCWILCCIVRGQSALDGEGVDGIHRDAGAFATKRTVGTRIPWHKRRLHIVHITEAEDIQGLPRGLVASK
jgi:hypothetical protein